VKEAYSYGFEKLEVWQVSRKLVKVVYELTATFPPDERFGLTSQLRRVIIGVSSNIAEGNSRITNKDKAHFITIAFSSLMEVLNQLILSADLGFLQEKQVGEIRIPINELANKLNAFHRSILK
jgi:four helix bundle protein